MQAPLGACAFDLTMGQVISYLTSLTTNFNIVKHYFLVPPTGFEPVRSF